MSGSGAWAPTGETPAGSWAPPGSWQPQPPPPRGRRGWVWVLVLSLVAIVVLAGVTGTILGFKVKPPLDAANDYMRAIAHHDYDDAFAQLCPANRVDESPLSLERDLQSGALFRNLEDWDITPFDVNRDGSRATVEVDLRPDDDDEPDILRIELRKIDGTWRPCGDVFGFDTNID